MSDIPEDIMRTARTLADDATCMGYTHATLDIAHAIMAERERSKTHWLQWHQKRVATSRMFWLRAAKAALAGDTRELRNRVDLCEAEPVELVLSEDSAICSPERAGE